MVFKVFQKLFHFTFDNRHLINNCSITITASRQLITDPQHWLTNSDFRDDWHIYNLSPIPVRYSVDQRASPGGHEGIELFKGFLEGEPGQVVAAAQARHYLHIATFKGRVYWSFGSIKETKDDLGIKTGQKLVKVGRGFIHLVWNLKEYLYQRLVSIRCV